MQGFKVKSVFLIVGKLLKEFFLLCMKASAAVIKINLIKFQNLELKLQYTRNLTDLIWHFNLDLVRNNSDLRLVDNDLMPPLVSARVKYKAEKSAGGCGWRTAQEKV